MTQSGHRTPLAPGEIRIAIVGDRTFQVMHVAGGSYTQASVRRNGWSSVVLKTDPSSYVAVRAYADAVEQAESDAARAIEGTVPVPLYPKGTPEYDAYAAELKTELAKWAAGEEPYPYRPGHPLADREPAPPWRCPTCGSRQPSMHPAVSDGKVTHLCLDPFHGAPAGVATWRPATEGETPGQCEPEHGPTQPITADDEPKWRVIITDSESLTGVAPVCDSPRHVEYARRSGMDEGNTGPDWVFDCCPHPQIELWGEANAILVAEIFNQAGAGLAGA